MEQISELYVGPTVQPMC